MRHSIFFALGVIFLTSFSLKSSFGGSDLTKKNPQQYPNYVVIGAFSVHKNAIHFTEEAVKNSYSAKFEMNFNRKLYYVYVMITGDHDQAIAEALRLRKESPYFDTWVYNGLLGKEGKHVVGEDINPVTSQEMKSIESNQPTPIAVIEEVASSQPQQDTSTSVATVNSEKQEVVIEEPDNEPDDETEGKKFFFKIFRGDNGSQIEGDVDVIDAQKARKLGSYAGNKQVKISSPPSKEGNISLICEVFGFRKVQHDINYSSPEGEGIEIDDKNETVVPFELIRLQKGDHAIMYNVFFFKDAAIMRPESRYEVNSLLSMLQENPKYKIKIHGHTNGGAHGKIISMSKDSENFFSLSNTNDGFGSAKKLSQERAELIKSYLVKNGIEASRMQIKAWGGKKALYDKHSAQAQSNVRVEIEILDN